MSYKIRLDIFEGPLDLLLYLIKKDELNIYDIPITRITEQYLQYLGVMEQLDLNIAGDFLVMAASLMQIKSKMLLPPDPEGPAEEEADPRADLVRRLLEYKSFKDAAGWLRQWEERRADYFTREGIEPIEDGQASPLEATLFDLLGALSSVLADLPKTAAHEVSRDEYTVADKIEEIRGRVGKGRPVKFRDLFKAASNKYEVITTFLALLELIRLHEIVAVQSDYFGDIELARPTRAAGAQEGRRS